MFRKKQSEFQYAPGIEKIIEVKLDNEEKQLLEESAKAVKSVMDVLDNMKMF